MFFSYNWHAFSSKTGHYRRKTIWQDKKRNCTKTAQRKKTMLGNIIPNFQKPVKLIKCHSNLSIMLYLTISSTFWHDVSFFQTEDQNYFLCSSKKYGRSICTWNIQNPSHNVSGSNRLQYTLSPISARHPFEVTTLQNK